MIYQDIHSLLKKFIAQAKTDDLKTRDYPNKIYNLMLKVSFGKGVSAKIPWVSILGEGQKTSEGIYPVYLYFKEVNTIILCYGISEENVPEINWPNIHIQTISDYLRETFDYSPPRYGNSKLFQAYDLNNPLNKEEVNKDLYQIVKEYKDTLNNSTISNTINDTVSTYKTDKKMKKTIALNSILYGPPGTGKTFNTINKALEIIDPEYLAEKINNRSKLNARFGELKAQKRISFVTFHQSFSYEDFVEGIKAETNGDKLNYTVEDGVFKMICSDAAPEIEKGTDIGVEVKDKTIWKMSLGNTLGDDYGIFNLCIDNNEIRLGYGRDLDFTGCDSKEAIAKHFVNKKFDGDAKGFALTAVHNFKNQMKIGDIVIITDGNLKFRAIAEISGEYFHSTNEHAEDYVQTRSVIWHKVFEHSLPYDRIMNKKFSQMTIYKPSIKAINLENLQELLNPDNISVKDGKAHTSLKPRVLIIDEINRGNISAIFGELITLIEPSKRSGAAEELSVTLPYSKERFTVPNNLHIIGTMNTADRSLALMDTALRRRFDFVEMMPEPALLKGIIIKGIDIEKMLVMMNQRIEVLYDREHTLGHAFFMHLNEYKDVDDQFVELGDIFKNKIIPLLEEYFFEDWEKIRLVLADNQTEDKDKQFITENTTVDTNTLFGRKDNRLLVDSVVFKRNDDAIVNPEAYRKIHG